MAENHRNLLKVHCRICGQKKVGPNSKGVQIKNHPQLIRWLRFLHDIEIERESEEIYPTRACDGCISRLRNVSLVHNESQRKALENVFELATKLHTNGQDDELRKLSRQFPVADFWAHSSSGMCSICDDSQKDTFPSTDPAAGYLIVEVQLESSSIKIIKFTRTASRPPGLAANKRETDAKASDTNETKKAKIETVSSSAAAPAAASSVSSLSSGQAWLGFIEALGRNRRSRCDKIAELLKWSNADDPKVLSDLKNSGITYKIIQTRHTTPNVEFKSTLAKCKRLLSSFPASKRALMLFRAITDTVTDGKLELMTHVGINVNLEHSNLAFLKKKICNKKAEILAKEQQQASQQQQQQKEVKTKRQAALAAANAVSIITEDDAPVAKPAPASRKAMVKNKQNSASVPKLPSGITIMKVPKNASAAATPAASASTAPPSSPSSSSTSSRSEASKMLIDRPSLDESSSSETITINQGKVKRAIADIERKHLPANRQMKTDVIFDCLHLRTDSPNLLADHGIIYNPKLGKHHLRVLSGQRKVHKNAIIKATENMNKYEWAAVMAQLVFNLLHTEDTLTLRVAGLMIDPFHSSSPLSFRMGFMLKHLFISGDDPGLSRNLLLHVLKSCDMDPQIPSNDRKIEDALVQLLYCDAKEAKTILAATKKPIKISLKSAAHFNKSIVNNSQRSTTVPALTNRRKIIFKEEPDPLGGAAEKYQQRPTRSRGRPSREIKLEEDADYIPGKKLAKKLPSSISVTSSLKSQASNRASKTRGVRGKYNKSEEQRAKEQARIAQLDKAARMRELKRKQAEAAEARRAAAQATQNYFQDPMEMDPLAVPIEPLDTVIKTEVIDDELPPNIIGDHHHGLAELEPVGGGDVSGLMIASVIGNLASIDSPGVQSSGSLDIENNPIHADPFENMTDEPTLDDNEQMEISRTEDENPILPDESDGNPLENTHLEKAVEENPPQSAAESLDPFENPLEMDSNGDKNPTEEEKNPQENPLESQMEIQNPLMEAAEKTIEQNPLENEENPPLSPETAPEKDELESEAQNPIEPEENPFETSPNPDKNPLEDQNDLTCIEAQNGEANPLDDVQEKPLNPLEESNPLDDVVQEKPSNPFEESNPLSENGTLDDLMSDKIHDPLNNGVVTPTELSSLPQNGQQNADPFAASTSTNFNHQDQQQDIVNELLQTNTNGDNANTPASMLDEDANDFFDKLIG